MASGSVSEKVLGRLEKIFGDRFSRDREDVIAASYDATKRAVVPEAVVWPLSTAEVVALVRLANEEGFPVSVRGAASGLTGGAVPTPGAVVADLSRMDRILEIDRANLTALVEPGVVVEHASEGGRETGPLLPAGPRVQRVLDHRRQYRRVRRGAPRPQVRRDARLRAATRGGDRRGRRHPYRLQHDKKRHRLRHHEAHRRQRGDARDYHAGAAQAHTASRAPGDGGGVFQDVARRGGGGFEDYRREDTAEGA